MYGDRIMSTLNKVGVMVLNSFPKKSFSQIVEKWSRKHLTPQLSQLQIKLFANIVKINIEEAEHPLNAYPTLNAFFTRKLKEGVREINNDPSVLISPVDGKIESFNDIYEDTLIQAKGIPYNISPLLMDRIEAKRFINGKFITIYLSPQDYHRIHFPYGGKVTSYRHIPGKCYPVGKFSTQNIPSLYCINERVITYISTPKGNIALIMVAAMGVGNMSLSYLPLKEGEKPDYRIYGDSKLDSINREKGDELGIFHLGSTVVMLFEKDTIDFSNIEKDKKVKIGEQIGMWK
jgi:phosphatidylserine decarboxylase